MSGVTTTASNALNSDQKKKLLKACFGWLVAPYVKNDLLDQLISKRREKAGVAAGSSDPDHIYGHTYKVTTSDKTFILNLLLPLEHKKRVRLGKDIYGDLLSLFK